MARKTLSLELEGDVSLAELAEAVAALQEMADTLGARVAPNARIRWVVKDLEAGSARAEAIGILENDPQGDDSVVDAIITELEHNAQASEAHQPVDPSIQIQFERLTSIINGHVTAVRIGGEERFALQPSDAPRPITALPARVRDIGEVTGRVEAMHAHSGNWFSLYELLHGKRVKVAVPADLVPRMDDWWRQIVTVRGVVTRDATGHPISVADLRDVTVHEPPAAGTWRRAIAAGDR